MWSYPPEDMDLVVRAVRNSPALAAHVAYFAGDTKTATEGYREAMKKLLPKIELAERSKPARVVLNACTRLSLYAWRAKDTAALTSVWKRWGLAYSPESLDASAVVELCTLAILVGQDDTDHTHRAATALPPDSLHRRVLTGLRDATHRVQALDTLRAHFEDYSGDGTALRPWDEEPLIACYERLHSAAGTDWRKAHT